MAAMRSVAPLPQQPLLDGGRLSDLAALEEGRSLEGEQSLLSIEPLENLFKCIEQQTSFTAILSLGYFNNTKKLQACVELFLTQYPEVEINTRLEQLISIESQPFLTPFQRENIEKLKNVFLRAQLLREEMTYQSIHKEICYIKENYQLKHREKFFRFILGAFSGMGYASSVSTSALSFTPRSRMAEIIIRSGVALIAVVMEYYFKKSDAAKDDERLVRKIKKINEALEYNLEKECELRWEIYRELQEIIYLTTIESQLNNISIIKPDYSLQRLKGDFNFRFNASIQSSELEPVEVTHKILTRDGLRESQIAIARPAWGPTIRTFIGDFLTIYTTFATILAMVESEGLLFLSAAAAGAIVASLGIAKLFYGMEQLSAQKRHDLKQLKKHLYEKGVARIDKVQNLLIKIKDEKKELKEKIKSASQCNTEFKMEENKTQKYKGINGLVDDAAHQIVAPPLRKFLNNIRPTYGRQFSVRAQEVDKTPELNRARTTGVGKGVRKY